MMTGSKNIAGLISVKTIIKWCTKSVSLAARNTLDEDQSSKIECKLRTPVNIYSSRTASFLSRQNIKHRLKL